MMENMMRLVKDESGQGMAEYGLILALVSIAAIIALTLIGTNLDLIFNDVAGNL